MRAIDQVELIHKVAGEISPEAAKILQCVIELEDLDRPDLVLAVCDTLSSAVEMVRDAEDYPEIIGG